MPTRPGGVPRITMVVAAALLIGILVLVVDNTAALVLSIAVVTATLLTVMVGVTRIPVLRRLARGHQS